MLQSPKANNWIAAIGALSVFLVFLAVLPNEWLQDMFFLLQIGIGCYTIWPITLGGVFLGLATSKISNRRMRIPSLIGIVIIQLASVGPFLVSDGDGLAWLLPVWIAYPYIHMSTLLFLWIPIIAQLHYVTKKPLPDFWVPALIGLSAVVAGAMFFLIMGIVVGAQTD